MKESLRLSAKRFFWERWKSKFVGLVVSGLLIAIAIARDLILSKDHSLKEIFTIISTFFLIEIISDYIEASIRIKNIKKKHFPMSFPIVNDKIIEAFHKKSKTKDNGHIRDNKRLDRIIKPPVEYTKEVLTGNTTPPFEPNAKYLEEIYDNDITHIVAITAENPNLWLDSTLSFYMLNCCAVSLIRKKNEHTDKKTIVIKDLENKAIYNKFKNKSIETLTKLSKNETLTSFEFIRFILFNNEHYDCLHDSVFPSLKASQDLFKIKSYFLNYEKIKNNTGKNIYENYSKNVKDLWDIILKIKENKRELHNEFEVFKEIVSKRKENILPEFLLLYKKNGDIILHTYLAGNDERVHFKKGDKIYYDNVLVLLNNIISFLASYRLKNNTDDWVPNDRNFNSKKSYIDWE